MSLVFVILASVLVGGISLWLFVVLRRGGHGTNDLVAPDRVNVAVLRDQLAELETDHINGTLSVDELADAKSELQRRALDETVPHLSSTGPPAGSKRAAIAVAVLLPIATVLTYSYLGNPAAINPPPQVRSAGTMTEADIQAMVASLQARLAQHPDDPEGWLMLARSYRYFGDDEKAVDAFIRANNLVQNDPQALSEYAESLSKIRSSSFEGEPTRLLERALELDPNAALALTLAGAAAVQRRDYQTAIEHWKKLLEMMPPDSEAAKIVAAGIERAQSEQEELDRPEEPSAQP
ncbi:c-type cytochrome biogenesis protein CcmI [Comamonas sp. Y6]|uniref:C-type cytochrome biogenesis protein CcmI n=1 Tax=Comamonas resistens TaxID=3046670 RepID=A0ABY8SS00_9BURK|nr:c-type cytochrome biogenesis protein CcmI [Comamonas resistens]MDL5035859.1 c-type cytochrome biogenesis protein CcmI [Comamonas resistens]WHS65266.1 c-type cytochrome biogenesis protein CcmI [Comamonas resistens]HBP0978943.1 c-type cytochrome biogenesis protein CcmI [Pseudomonas aeruginosa]